ncbi:MAG: MATE family efflux transporter [Candidatus Micrarchaeota archaeon]
MPNEKKSRAAEFLKDYKGALHKLAIPMLIGFGVTTLYNVVDTIFVGGLGYEAIAALTFAFPVFFFMFAISMGLGVGFTATIAMAIGAKDKGRADNAAEHAMLLSALLGIGFGVIGWWLCPSIFSLLGAEGRVLDLSVEYFNIIFISLPILFWGVFGRAVLAGEGDMDMPMKVVVVSSFINIVLDPLFIYAFGWGIAGAAWATVLSSLFVALVYTYFLVSKKGSYIDLDLRDFRFSPGIFRQAALIGIPAMLAQGTMALGQAFINLMVAPFGAVAVAGFGLGVRVDFVIFIPFMAVGGALTTLAGMYHGAGRDELIRKVLYHAISICFVVSVLAGIPLYIFAEPALSIFTDDPEVISVGVQYIRLIVFVYPLVAIAMNIGRTLSGVGKSLEGLIITSTRVFIVFIPAAIYFTTVLGMGLEGIWYAIICAGIVSASVAIYLLRMLPK